MLSGEKPLAAQLEKSHVADRAKTGHGDVLRNAEIDGEAGSLPVFGHQRDSRANRIARAADAHRLPADLHHARINWIDAEQSPAQFRASRADESAHADDFSRAHAETDVVEQRLAGESIHAQHFIARRNRLASV